MQCGASLTSNYLILLENIPKCENVLTQNSGIDAEHVHVASKETELWRDEEELESSSHPDPERLAACLSLNQSAASLLVVYLTFYLLAVSVTCVGGSLQVGTMTRSPVTWRRRTVCVIWDATIKGDKKSLKKETLLCCSFHLVLLPPVCFQQQRRRLLFTPERDRRVSFT